MLQRILSLLGFSSQNQELIEATRRRHFRFQGKAIAHVTIGDKTFPVRDWSQGGMFFDANDNNVLHVGDEASFIRKLSIGDELAFTLHFQIPETGTVAFAHKARVVRAQHRGVATQFAPLTKEARRLIARVIDSVNAQSFSDSQLVA